MMAKTRATIGALVLLVSACNPNKQAPTPITRAENLGSANTQQSKRVQAKFEPAFAECGQLAQNTTSVVTNLEGARRLHELLDCSESYLTNFPEGESSEDAERLRYKAAVASLEVLREIERQAAEPSSSTESAASAQSKLVDREEVRKLAVQNSRYIRRAIHYRTVQIYRTSFEDLTANGVTMGDAEEWQGAQNTRYKNQGIWEFPILAKYHNGRFLAVLETLDRAAAPLFVVEGYGVVQPSTMIRDENFDTTGVFSDDCQVSVRTVEVSFTQPCNEYLAGDRTPELARRVKNGIEVSLKAKAQDKQSAN